MTHSLFQNVIVVRLILEQSEVLSVSITMLRIQKRNDKLDQFIAKYENKQEGSELKADLTIIVIYKGILFL